MRESNFGKNQSGYCMMFITLPLSANAFFFGNRTASGWLKYSLTIVSPYLALSAHDGSFMPFFRHISASLSGYATGISRSKKKPFDTSELVENSAMRGFCYLEVLNILLFRESTI